MPTPLLLTSPRPQLLADLAAQLAAKTARGREGPTELRVHPDVPRAEVDELVARLHPVETDLVEDGTIEGMVLHVGSIARLGTPLRVLVPPAWRDALALASLPVQTPCVHVAAISVPASVSIAANLLLAILGLPDSGCWQDGTGLSLRVNERACRGIQAARVMRVYGDAGSAAVCRRALRGLRRDGWEVEVVETERPAEVCSVLVPEALDPSVRSQLLHTLTALSRTITEKALATHAHPWVEVRLPQVRDAASEPTMPTILLRTDALDDVHALVRSLRELGAPTVTVRAGLVFASGFAVRHHPKHPTSLVRDLEQLVAAAIDGCRAGDRHLVNLYSEDADARLAEIEIDLPLRGGADGSLLRALLASAGSYEVRISNMPRPTELVRRLEMAFAVHGARPNVGGDRRTHPFPQVALSRAPLEIGRLVAEAVREATGVGLPVHRASGCEDGEIRVFLPKDVRVIPAPGRPRAGGAVRAGDALPFLEVSNAVLRVGEHTLARGPEHALAPSPALFQHTCIDAPTASLLAHLAASVRLREPVLLEGPTAAGKTSTVLFLAALLRQPVVRLNLSGQTDTGELIGRYAPRDGGWAWREGVIPRAMREGWWVILDEINLADPAVIERLNPVLERTPSLLVTEGDNTRFGPGGTAVAPGFHVFATMNPSDGEYGGRNALSPALRDRFPAQLLCPAPGDGDARELLLRIVFGEQPSITVAGTTWLASSDHAATHGALSQLAGVRPALECLGRFHASVDAAAHAEAEDQRLGSGRREGVVVSRRTLLSVLDYLVLRVPEVGLQTAIDQAVDRYYAARFSAEADRQAVQRLAEAAGLLAAGRPE